MFEIDDETWKFACSYCGGDPRIPIPISVEEHVLGQYESLTLTEFQDLIANKIEQIPLEYRASVRVELDACDHEGYGGALTISYDRLQTSEEVAARVKRAIDYALSYLGKERADYERLKKKFG